MEKRESPNVLVCAHVGDKHNGSSPGSQNGCNAIRVQATLLPSHAMSKQADYSDQWLVSYMSRMSIQPGHCLAAFSKNL